MPAYFATPKSSVTSVPANTATKVPAVAQASRLMLKLFLEPDVADDPLPTGRYGGPEVSATVGIPFSNESDWIPCSGDIWVFCTVACKVQALEGA